MDSGIRDKISLEFIQINIKTATESDRSSQGGNNLGDHSVQVGISRSFNIQIASADVIESLIVKREADSCMIKQGMSREN